MEVACPACFARFQLAAGRVFQACRGRDDEDAAKLCLVIARRAEAIARNARTLSRVFSALKQSKTNA